MIRPDGKPTFPLLHQRDERDKPVPVARGAVPDVHGLRHTAASEAIASGESVEEVSWMLGHRDSTVTKQVYVHELQSQERRARRRALLEERYGSALEAAERNRTQQTPEAPEAPAGEVVDLREVRDRAQ